MTGCRIASEDRGDPHFDGFDEDGYDKPTRRDRLENLLEDIQVLIDELYELEEFEPDEDDIYKAVAFYHELQLHKRTHNAD